MAVIQMTDYNQHSTHNYVMKAWYCFLVSAGILFPD